VQQIQVSEILKILRINDIKLLKSAIETELETSRARGYAWSIDGNFVNIKRLSNAETNIDADEVIRNMLTYAHEIETIN